MQTRYPLTHKRKHALSLHVSERQRAWKTGVNVPVRVYIGQILLMRPQYLTERDIAFDGWNHINIRNKSLSLPRMARRQVIRHFNRPWHRPMSKRFIKHPYSISRATPIDSDCCYLPTAGVLGNKANKSSTNQF